MKKKISKNWKIIISWITGLGALIWLLIRSGSNPKRLTYPCQQAAMPIAANWLILTFVYLTSSVLLKRFFKLSAVTVTLVGIVWFVGSTIELGHSEVKANLFLPTWTSSSPVSSVFVFDKVPPTSGSLAAGDASVPDEYLSDPAMDTLFMIMETNGTYLYKTVAQPSGLIGSDDIIIIKGNFQWTSRNTTCTDRIKGFIWKVLQHPDGFTGEILICDNTQNFGTGVNHGDNNSDDEEQSIVDVANTFFDKGYPVYVHDWTYMWDIVVTEYSDGDMNDGYTFDPQTLITYPKFQTPSGNHYVSLRYGIWDEDSQSYDHDRLSIINFPVTKAHAMSGATIGVKNWIGLATTAYYDQRYTSWESMHYTYFWSTYALVARIMEVTFPKLTIIDAMWTSTNNAPDLCCLVKTDVVLASTDPVAASWYAARYVLTPVALRPNHTNPEGTFYGITLNRWTDYFQSVSFPVTNDSADMSVFDRETIYPISFSADIDFGKIPFDVNFTPFSNSTVNNHKWYFGDGDSAMVENPTHTYLEPGFHDVTLNGEIDGQQVSRTYSKYIIAIADTVKTDSYTGALNQSVEITITGNNSIPIREINLPIEYPGEIRMSLDSFSTVGCRTDYFEDVSIAHFDPFNKRFTISLVSQIDSIVDNDLPVGSGPILKVYFKIKTPSTTGQISQIVFDGYPGHPAEYITRYYDNYTLESVPGELLVACCKGIRGNVDNDIDDMVDIGDLVYLVEYQFDLPPGPEPSCFEEADVNADLSLDIEDIVMLVEYQFDQPPGPPPFNCP